MQACCCLFQIDSLQSTIQQLEGERSQLQENLRKQRDLADHLSVKVSDQQEEIVHLSKQSYSFNILHIYWKRKSSCSRQVPCHVNQSFLAISSLQDKAVRGCGYITEVCLRAIYALIFQTDFFFSRSALVCVRGTSFLCENIQFLVMVSWTLKGNLVF